MSFSTNTALQLALLGGGLVLSVSSSGTTKNKGHSQVTIAKPVCSHVRPASLKRLADRYALNCRYNGGTPTVKYSTTSRKGHIICRDGTKIHIVEVSCAGAQFDKRLMQFTKPTDAPKLPTTAAEKAAAAKIFLDAHNHYRRELHLPLLIWSERLAQFAEKYAQQLAAQGGTLVHSNPRKTGQGENLWSGTAGQYSYKQMIDTWGKEGANFTNGIFGQSRQWQLVSHYTQMIWRDTKQVGCALARAGGNDILLCRYWPPGNVIDQKPF